jgi:hypothetical protein
MGTSLLGTAFEVSISEIGAISTVLGAVDRAF